MKVAYVTMHFPAPSETFAGTDILALRSLGAEVDVFSLMPARPRHAEMIDERGLSGVRIRTMTLRRWLRGLASALRMPRRTTRWIGWFVSHARRQPMHVVKSFSLAFGALSIADDLRHQDYDVVHLFWGHYPALVGELALQLQPKPVVSTFLGAYDLSTDFGPSRSFAPRADVVFTHAAVNVDAILALRVPRERIHVVYRGVPSAGMARVASASAPTRDPERIVTAARLIPSKRVEDVVEAFSEIASAWPSATLSVLGDGPQRDALTELVARHGLGHRVRFLGHRPHHEVLAEMRRSGACILLSTKDGERLPNVVKEAMACGCVPIVARTPGIEELVDDQVNGFVVAPGSVAEAASRLAFVMGGGAAVEAMREQARQRIEERFDAVGSMRQYLSAWAQAQRAAAE